MLPAFPKQFPDELHKHRVARYQARMNYPTDRDAIKEVCGPSGSLGSLAVPNGLKYLDDHLMPGRSGINDLIGDNTFLKLLQPFIPQERFERLYNKILLGKAGDISLCLGSAVGSIAMPTHYQYCRHCVRDDRKSHGEAYFHRTHHGPGVKMCAKHRVRLVQTNVPIHDGLEPNRLVTAETVVSPGEVQGPDLSIATNRQLLAIAVDISWLLQQTAEFSLERVMHFR